MQFKKTVLGGTFDRIHNGHFVHLRSAFAVSEHVTIGLTTRVMLSHKILAELIEPYDIRERELKKYINYAWPDKPYSVVPIDDMYGPTLTDITFDAIAVTPDTKKNGLKVIRERNKRGLSELKLIECELVPAGDGGHLSSTRIRLGQIDRQGRPYSELFTHSLRVPEAHRDALRQPLGTTIGRSADHAVTARKALQIIDKEKPTLIITVGDIVSRSLLDLGLHPNISLIDIKSDGKEIEGIKKPHRYDVVNPAGTIRSESVSYIEKTYSESLNKMSSKVILVDGEEDLLALPCILLAPLNAVVIYGQKDHGIILNSVTEDIKEKVRNLVLRFIKV